MSFVILYITFNICIFESYCHIFERCVSRVDITRVWSDSTLSQPLQLNVSWMSFVTLNITFNICIFVIFRCIYSQNSNSFWQWCKCGYPLLRCHLLSVLQMTWHSCWFCTCNFSALLLVSWLRLTSLTLADFAFATSQLCSWCLGSIDHRSLVLKTRSWSWYLFAPSLAQGTEVDVLTTCASCLGLGSLAHRRLALGVALALELLDNLRFLLISRANALGQLRLFCFLETLCT